MEISQEAFYARVRYGVRGTAHFTHSIAAIAALEI